MEFGIHALTSNLIQSYPMSSPVGYNQLGLYYSRHLKKWHSHSLYTRTIMHLANFPSGMVVAAVAISFVTALLKSEMTRLTGHEATNGLSKCTSERISGQSKTRLSLLNTISIGILCWSFGINARGGAIGFLRIEHPFSGPGELESLLMEKKLRLQFVSDRGYSYSIFRHSNLPIFLSLSQTFASNPPYFSPQVSLHHQPTHVYFGFNPTPMYYEMEAEWMREWTTPVWGSLILGRGPNSKRTQERLNRVIDAFSAFKRNYRRINGFDVFKTEKRHPKEEYQRLDLSFAKDMVLIGLAIPVVSGVYLMVEIVYCRLTRTVSIRFV